MPKPPKRIAFDGDMGALAVLPDGRLVTFYADVDRLENVNTVPRPERWVYKRFSADNGRTWTAAERAFPIAAGRGVGWMMPLPLVTRDGAIHLFGYRIYEYGWPSGPWRSTLEHATSSDGGQTWTAAREIDYGHRYTGALNAVLQLDGGRILLPFAYLGEERTEGKFVCMAVYSDDGGRTWGKSNDIPVAAGGQFIESGADEPVIAPLAGGLIWMLIRTTTGCFWESFSNDGAVWTPPQPTRLVSCNAPGGLLRLRDGRIALFWNNLYGEPYIEGISYARQKLFGALSSNEGQTWSAPKVVVQKADGEPVKAQTTYPFPIQAPDGSILVLYHHVYGQEGRDWRDPLRELVRVDPDWLAAR